MPIRPLLLVAALAGGDYLLWMWSSDGGSATAALISGLALAPLILFLLWLLSVAVARALLMRSSDQDEGSAGEPRRRAERRQRRLRVRAPRRAQIPAQPPLKSWQEQDGASATSARQSSEKIAA